MSLHLLLQPPGGNHQNGNLGLAGDGKWLGKEREAALVDRKERDKRRGVQLQSKPLKWQKNMRLHSFLPERPYAFYLRTEFSSPPLWC